MNLFLDIETAPDATPGALASYRELVKPPGSYKKPESIAQWMAENADAEAERLWKKTALNGGYGEILVVGWAWEDQPVNILSRRLEPDEQDLLTRFYDLLQAELTDRRYSESGICVVGHNIGFDLRFLFQRTCVHTLFPAVRLPVEHRPGSDRTFCTMAAWCGYRETVSLKDLATCLGLHHHKNDVDGSQVFDLWRVDPALVEDYCQKDVALTRQVYRRLKMLPVEAWTPELELTVPDVLEELAF